MRSACCSGSTLSKSASTPRMVCRRWRMRVCGSSCNLTHTQASRWIGTIAATLTTTTLMSCIQVCLLCGSLHDALLTHVTREFVYSGSC